MNQHTNPQSISQKADELEEHMMHDLERVMTKSTLHYLADGEVKMDTSAGLWAKHPGAVFNMGPDPRLPPMPAKPTLIDYFKTRFAQHAHLLQSATHALRNLTKTGSATSWCATCARRVSCRGRVLPPAGGSCVR